MNRIIRRILDERGSENESMAKTVQRRAMGSLTDPLMSDPNIPTGPHCGEDGLLELALYVSLDTKSERA